ncbi:hypothetical protein QBC46DRAFT_387237 [Diplogelasinospora grovesii]|uniref:Secreted protein n=1 Tax=Diplogelasinospora grovesii TaxID=303347 RepID=A0AAN6N5U5_9PEZI|nr:hypothetical protein QBC46DRAFT_387237 [Diplogelasinospora grovesii]
MRINEIHLFPLMLSSSLTWLSVHATCFLSSFGGLSSIRLCSDVARYRENPGSATAVSTRLWKESAQRPNGTVPTLTESTCESMLSVHRLRGKRPALVSAVSCNHAVGSQVAHRAEKSSSKAETK